MCGAGAGVGGAGAGSGSGGGGGSVPFCRDGTELAVLLRADTIDRCRRSVNKVTSII